MLTAPEIRIVRDDLRKAHGLVSAAFSTTRAAGISDIARDLRHIRNSLDDTIRDLGDMQAELCKAPPTGGEND